MADSADPAAGQLRRLPRDPDADGRDRPDPDAARAQLLRHAGRHADDPYVQEEADFVSFTPYGSAIGVYRPGSPFTTSLGDAELEVDDTGGSPILVWPRTLDAAERAKVIAYTEDHGFAVMRGEANELTTANLLVRLKGASPTYEGAYAPDSDRTGVPCYFGTVQKPEHAGRRWSAVTGDRYVASPRNIGAGAPQGVSGGTQALLDGAC